MGSIPGMTLRRLPSKRSLVEKRGTGKNVFKVLTPTLSAQNENVSMFHVAKTIFRDKYLPDLLCSQINVQIYLSFDTLRFAGNKKARRLTNLSEAFNLHCFSQPSCSIGIILE